MAALHLNRQAPSMHRHEACGSLHPLKSYHLWSPFRRVRMPRRPFEELMGSRSSSGGGFSCSPMRHEHLPSVRRLHKFAKLDGVPIFGSDLSGIEEMLEHASAGRSGTAAIVACGHADPSDVLGCVTAQLDPLDPDRSSSTESYSQRAESARFANKAGQQRATVPELESCEVCLLSLVVRADQRKCGVGRALVQALCSQAAGQHASRIVTDVAASNLPAVRFFEAGGFKRVGGSGGGNMVELTLMLPDSPART